MGGGRGQECVSARRGSRGLPLLSLRPEGAIRGALARPADIARHAVMLTRNATISRR